MPAVNSGVQGQGQGKGGGNKRRASLAATFDDTLLEAAATHPITGGGDDVLDGVALASLAGVRIVASLDAGLDVLTLAFAGNPVPTGALTATLEDAAVAAELIHLSTLSLARTLDATSISAAGGPVAAGVLAATLRNGALNSFGVLSPCELVLNAMLDDADFTAEGALPIAAATIVRLGPVTLSAHSPFASKELALDATLDSFVLAVGGGPVVTGSLAGALQAATVAAGTRGTAGATVLQTLEDVAVDAEAAELAAVAVTQVLEGCRCAAAGAVSITAQLIAELAAASVLVVPEVSFDRGDVVTRAERIDLYSRRRTDEEAFA